MNHFRPKVDSWAKVNHLSSLTEEQVLEVVRSNYDSLTLKLHDTLDHYERYSEKPKEANFFIQMVKYTTFTSLIKEMYSLVKLLYFIFIVTNCQQVYKD